MRAPFTQEYKDKCLERRKGLFWFSKVATIGFSLICDPLQLWVIFYVSWTKHSFCPSEWAWSTIRELLVTDHVCRYYILKVYYALIIIVIHEPYSWLGLFPPSITFYYVKASPQSGGFQAVCIFLGNLVSKVYGVFSKRILPSISGR